MRIRIYDAGVREQLKSGYGMMSRQLISNFVDLGHEIVFFPYDKKGEDVVLWLRPPHYIKYDDFDESRVNVFFTMHELSYFPGWKSDWPSLLNKCNAVITPTEWNKDVFIARGVTVPIYVVPLGINPKDFHGAKTYEFSVLTLHDALGRENSRENWQDTLVAFHDAFIGRNALDVILTIKSYNIRHAQYRTVLDSLRQGRDLSSLPSVRIMEVDLDILGLNNLYAKHWLFVKNANREGWSLPLWEAMSAGIRVVYTDLPVFDVIPSWRGRSFPLGDRKALGRIFRDEFKLWQKEKAFLNRYKWRRCAEKVASVLAEVIA